MKIDANEKEVYLYVNGLAVARPAMLDAGLCLQPTRAAMLPLVEGASPVDLGVMMTFLASVESELHVDGTDGRDLAIRAWNSIWDILLINAAFDRDAMVNLHSDCSAKDLCASSTLRVTNHALRGLPKFQPPPLSDTDLTWLETNIHAARGLLKDSRFENAVHCLATYRWHAMPRAQLALIWAGIEGLFDIDSEIAFRLSVHVAQFLGGDKAADRKATFDQVKRLYRNRSRAVHGGKLAENAVEACKESATLLRQLIRRCIEISSLPDTKAFVP